MIWEIKNGMEQDSMNRKGCEEREERTRKGKGMEEEMDKKGRGGEEGQEWRGRERECTEALYSRCWVRMDKKEA